MAKITRKLKTQERYQDVAKGPLTAFGSGHIVGLSLPEGARGVSFSLSGCGKDAKYSFAVLLTADEWDKLKKVLDGMLERNKRDQENFQAGKPYENDDFDENFGD